MNTVSFCQGRYKSKKQKKFTDAKLSKARYQMYLIQCLSLFFSTLEQPSYGNKIYY